MSSNSLIGKTVGKYRVVEVLGRGGMAEVYKAYQENLDRNVAMKVMHAFLADEADFLARFDREAKAMASLNHNNIVGVYDFDVQDGMYYIVMEFVSGGTLKKKLERLNRKAERMPLSETVQMVMEVADALAYAHSRGMVHRDIKPGNIMIGENGRAILTDFGIAKILSGPTVTATGAMIGTPAYMSPEQGLGKPGDERSDLYALGVLFYQMATGRLPYDADTPLAVILKHVNEPMQPPIELNEDIPPDIQAVIVKAMAKDPEERYQSAREMMVDLQNAAQAGNITLAAAASFAALRDRPTPPPTGVDETRIAAPAATIVAAGAATAAPAGATRVATPAELSETEIAPPVPPPAPTPVPVAEPVKKSRWWIAIIGLALILLIGGAAGGFFIFSGLGSSTPTPTEAVAVAVEETPTEEILDLPTDIVLPTADNISTAVALIAATLTAQPTETPQPTSSPTPTSTPTPDVTATFLAGCEPKAELVKSYTFQNENSNSTPVGVNFTMNWVIANSGECDLPDGLRLVYLDGEEFGGSESIMIEEALSPGDEIILRASLSAPNNPGSYSSSWVLIDKDDNPVGPEFDFEIRAFNPVTATPRPTNTPEVSPTPEVIEPFGYQVNPGSCEYVQRNWQCVLFITPYGGLGPYMLTVSDADPPSRYEGDGPFSHTILSSRCNAWVNTITVKDLGTGAELVEPTYLHPDSLFPGGCTFPAP